MATRKKTASQRSSRKKTTAGAAKKKTARKAASKKTTTRKAAAKAAPKATVAKTKSSPRASAKSAPRSKVATRATETVAAPAPAPRARKAAPKVEPPSPARVLADRIVAVTTGDPSDFDVVAFYTEDCVSSEPRGDAAVGYEGLAAKNAWWDDMQKRSTWSPRNVFVNGDLVCIEWEARVELRDGRILEFEEVAIHKVRDGKIAEERFYYDPGVFELPPVVEGEEPVPPPKPAPPRPTARPIETTGTPPVDPIDL